VPQTFNFPAKIMPFVLENTRLNIEQLGLDGALDLFFWSNIIS